MSIHTWHLLGVAVPYVLIATALWGLSAGAIKDAVRIGSIPERTRLRLAGRDVEVPTVPLAYGLGFLAVAFIYGCALDRNHMSAAIGMDPHAVVPGADAFLYGLAAASWLSATLLLLPYRWLRRGTRALLTAPADRDRAEARYSLLASHLTDLVCQHQPDGRYEWLSDSVEAILGYTPDELLGRDPYELFHPDDRARIRAESHTQILNGAQTDTLIRYRIRHKHGHYVWLESLTEPICDASGEILHLQVTSRDVTERQAIEADLLHRAHYDALTGLANRVLFTLRLDALVETSRAEGRDGQFAVLYLDLDRFKTINDTLGHGAGDDLLFQFAGRLRGATRGDDTVARIGGDEFAIVLEGADAADAAVSTAKRIDRALRDPFELDGAPRSVTASIGVATGRADHETAGEVLREADLAAYAAKAGGRARWAAFTPALREASDRRLRIEADLDGAVQRGELRMAYQPIVRLDTGTLHGVEALIRWEHPELGLLYPDTFISIAEETGRIHELDRWAMAEGLDQLERWDAAAGRTLDLSLSVNCSAGDLHAPSFVSSVQALIAGGPDRARRLVIEITESLLVDDPQRATTALDALHADGVRFSMDDFGTGYSSLSVVHALPVDAVKIDRAFVRRMHEDESAHEMVQTIIGFGRMLGTRIVAEGIETRAQLDALRALECDYGQGYLFDRPVSAERIGALLRTPERAWWERREGVAS